MMKRYSTTLLFQYRVLEVPTVQRFCLKRMFVIEARSARSALNKAKRRGVREQLEYQNGEGDTVLCEFVGVLDLVDLSTICDADEVWYEACEMKTPMERRLKIIPTDDQLLGRC